MHFHTVRQGRDSGTGEPRGLGRNLQSYGMAFRRFDGEISMLTAVLARHRDSEVVMGQECPLVRADQPDASVLSSLGCTGLDRVAGYAARPKRRTSLDCKN